MPKIVCLMQFISRRINETALSLLVFSTCCFSLAPPAIGQLELLIDPAVEKAEAWKSAQLATIDTQLEGLAEDSPLARELLAQKRWLEAWSPGGLTNQPLWETPERVQAQKQWEEPAIDPSGIATELRERLLGEAAKPTPEETQELRMLIEKSPRDIGLRQLHLHWLDQYQYRKQYADAIAESAEFVLTLLNDLPASEKYPESTLDRARAYAMYRRVRALAYRELPEVVEKTPILDMEKHTTDLLGAADSLFNFAGKGRKEFILMEVRLLRRNAMFGRALVMLEDYGNSIAPNWHLKKRRDILSDLGWTFPFEEAEKIYADQAADLPEE